MNVLYTLGDHVANERGLVGISWWQPGDFAVRRIGLVVIFSTQWSVDEANAFKLTANVLFCFADIQFGETTTFSHLQTRQFSYLGKLFIFRQAAKGLKPIDGQGPVIRTQTERRSVYFPVRVDTPRLCISNDLIPIRQVVAGHAFRNASRSKVRT